MVAVGDARTAADGSFELLEPDDQSRAFVLARCTADVVGAVGAEIELPAPAPVELRVENFAPAWQVDVEVDVEGEPPDELDLTLIPAALEGVPDSWLSFAWVPVGGLAHLGWLERRFAGASTSALVQSGRWTLRAGRTVAVAAQPADLRPATSWVTIAAEAAGRALEQGPTGFELDVRGPITVRLRVAARTSV
jgi:hypothetical protein